MQRRDKRADPDPSEATTPEVQPEFSVLLVPSPRELIRRLPRLLSGIVLLGIGIAMTVRARLGVAPYDVLHQGLAKLTGISFGAIVILVGLAVLLLWIPLRQMPGIGTIVNTLTVGYVADVALGIMHSDLDLRARVALLVGGIVFEALGLGLYIGAGLGPGPRDGLMTGLAARGRPLWLVRTGLELTALVAGLLLGGNVGVGTVLFAFSIGPLGHFFLRRLHLGAANFDPDPAPTLGE